jgi:hypothetical protein
MKSLSWESVPQDTVSGGGHFPAGYSTFRAKIPGGWLVALVPNGVKPPNDSRGVGLTFVPDEHDYWSKI